MNTQKDQTLKHGIVHHLRSQPFITATGFAALVHSTWSLGTFFSGQQPPVNADAFSGLWAVQVSQWLLWVIPAFAIAFALDVGQIVTSAEIRAGRQSKIKYATFATFAIATYYLQWLYLVHHVPYVALGAGVHPAMQNVVYVARDLAVFFLPLLLPLATLLYTFSHDDAKPAQVVTMQTVVTIEKSEPIATKESPPPAPVTVERKPVPALAQSEMLALPEMHESETEEVTPVGYPVKCAHCDWHTVKDTQRGAQNALTAHLRGCKANKKAKDKAK